MSFQEIILIAAIIILCLMLIIVGVMLYSKKYNDVFPPVEASCPDYWESKLEYDNTSKKNKTVCFNVKNLGSCQGENTKSFDSAEWNGSNGRCNKQKWARKCDLSWDGITNDVNACNSV